MAWSKDPNRYRGVPRNLAHQVRVRDNYTCRACGERGHEVDHRLSVKAGGTDALENLHVLCARCHTRKTAAESWAARKKKLDRLKLPEPKHPGLR